MYLKILGTRYNLAEFDLFINEVNGSCISVIELLVDCSVDEFDKKGLEDTFLVETDRLTYVFSDFVINEFYEENGSVKIICAK